jgi:hypothetical protein
MVRHGQPIVGRQTRIATIGSCFANRLVHVLEERGFAVAIHPGGLWYNTGSIAQELEHLFGDITLRDEPRWQADDGMWIHPFKDYHERFRTLDELEAWSEAIDDEARRMFESAEVVVVTLGLTEVWYSTATGRPLIHIPPPDLFKHGAGTFRPTHFEENRANLERIYETIAQHTQARLIVTVSPVPLYATFRDMDVRVANAISKSTLRAAVADLICSHPDVLYFHSYEIASSLNQPQLLFEPDGRHVRPAAVELIIAEFLKMFGDASLDPPVVDTSWLET